MQTYRWGMLHPRAAQDKFGDLMAYRRYVLYCCVYTEPQFMQTCQTTPVPRLAGVVAFSGSGA